MHEAWWRFRGFVVLGSIMLASVMANGSAAPAMTSNEKQFATGVVASAVGNPGNARALLQSAIWNFGTSTNAAIGMVSLFADEIGDVSSCDADQAKELAAALENVLEDPTNSSLVAQLPINELALVIANASSGGGSSMSSSGIGLPAAATSALAAGSTTASAGGSATLPTGAFGSFGSSAGTGVATSPAT